MRRRSQGRAPGPHPFILALCPVILTAPIMRADPIPLLAVIAAALAAAAPLGARPFVHALLRAGGVLILVGLGFLPWIGATRAAALALRMTCLLTTYTVSFAWIDPQELSDSLIRHARVPYALVDVVGMSGRFVALMRRELDEMLGLLRVEARGRRLPWLLSVPRVTGPMLAASFRQADLAAIALETRGFASRDTRTTRRARPPRPGDLAALSAVVALAVALVLVP